MVRKKGLEPLRGYPLEPKSSASTNSATFALFAGLSCGFSTAFSGQLKTVEYLPCRDLGRWLPCAKEIHFTVRRWPSTSAWQLPFTHCCNAKQERPALRYRLRRKGQANTLLGLLSLLADHFGKLQCCLAEHFIATTDAQRTRRIVPMQLRDRALTRFIVV